MVAWTIEQYKSEERSYSRTSSQKVRDWLSRERNANQLSGGAPPNPTTSGVQGLIVPESADKSAPRKVVAVDFPPELTKPTTAASKGGAHNVGAGQVPPSSSTPQFSREHVSPSEALGQRTSISRIPMDISEFVPARNRAANPMTYGEQEINAHSTSANFRDAVDPQRLAYEQQNTNFPAQSYYNTGHPSKQRGFVPDTVDNTTVGPTPTQIAARQQLERYTASYTDYWTKPDPTKSTPPPCPPTLNFNGEAPRAPPEPLEYIPSPPVVGPGGFMTIGAVIHCTNGRHSSTRDLEI
ncbi:AAEL006078-PA [Aedes aegypti]|uniref:AAEL006078-PA n=1 Tax=Aedes aegypti TaxID=7159 RepID=Q177N7_AEDAE|nr:AAEL006078-PA [Aedes aegypti]